MFLLLFYWNIQTVDSAMRRNNLFQSPDSLNYNLEILGNCDLNNLIALNSRFIVIFLANIDFKKCLMESVLWKNSKNDNVHLF